MRATRHLGLLATFVVALMATVATIALFSSIQFAYLERNARTALLEDRAYSQALDDVLSAVIDAETAQRGYLLTGDQAYLAPYVRAQALIEAFRGHQGVFEILREEAGSPLLQRVDLKMAELAETIRLFDAGEAPAALSLVQTDVGEQYMRDIRQIVSDRKAAVGLRTSELTDRATRYNQRSSIITTLLGILMVLAIIMGVVVFRQWRRTSQAESEAGEAIDTAERIEVIANELDHRMKNLFAVTQGMLRQSARRRGDDIRQFAQEACDRLDAMSHAYSATRELGDMRMLSASTIIDRVVRSQLLEEHRFDAHCDPREIVGKAVSPFALILHEWTTNALKYGAWKPNDQDDDQSRVSISWQLMDDGRYELLWDETHDRGTSDIPAQTGYGSKLIKACAAQLGGSVDYDWHESGVRIRLRADPLRLGFVPTT